MVIVLGYSMSGGMLGCWDVGLGLGPGLWSLVSSLSFYVPLWFGVRWVSDPGGKLCTAETISFFSLLRLK